MNGTGTFDDIYAQDDKTMPWEPYRLTNTATTVVKADPHRNPANTALHLPTSVRSTRLSMMRKRFSPGTAHTKPSSAPPVRALPLALKTSSSPSTQRGWVKPFWATRPSPLYLTKTVR